VNNYEKLPMPVTVEIKEDNGKTGRVVLPVEVWQHGPSWKFAYSATGNVQQVIVDPDKKLPDTDTSNNTWPAR
jgi:hypothetical protein